MASEDEVLIRLKLKDARVVAREIDKVADEVDELGDKTEKAGRKSEKANKKAGFFRKGLRRLGKAALFAGVALAGIFAVGVVKAVNHASDLEESINKTTATFEGASPAILEWSKTTANALGLSRADSLEGAASIGAMLKPMGIAPKQAAKMSKSMTILAADMASFNNEDPTEMLDRIRSGLSGESEPLKRFGAVLSQTRVAQHAANMGMIEQGETMTEQQKIMARYSLLLSDTKDQQGDFGRTADGLANSRRRLGATWVDLQAKMGKVFLPVALKVTNWALQFLNWSEKNWPKWKKTVSGVWDETQVVIQSALGWYETNIAPTIDSILKKVRWYWRNFGDETIAILQLIQRILLRFVLYLKAMAEFASAIIRGDWGAAWTSFKRMVSLTVENVKDILTSLVPVLGSLAKKAGVALGKGIASGAESAMVGLGDMLKGMLKASVNVALDGIRGIRIPGFEIDPPGPGPKFSFPGVSPFAGIPQLATGGTVMNSGLAMVGEAGPEIMSLPQGASVAPLPALTNPLDLSAFGGGADTIHTTVELDGRVLAESVTQHARTAEARR